MADFTDKLKTEIEESTQVQVDLADCVNSSLGMATTEVEVDAVELQLPYDYDAAQGTGEAKVTATYHAKPAGSVWEGDIEVSNTLTATV